MKLSLSLQQDFQAPELVLKRGYIKKIVEAVLRHIGTQSNCEIGIACVDHDESHKLNLEYRGKDKSTNVLSFPSDLPDEMAQILDSFPVHGTLHLMGYDHETSEADAEEMEGIEIEILAKLGFENPYLEQ